VRQQPGSGKAYTATGTALTLSEATASTDTMYCVFLGRALQTVTPATNSITAAMVGNDLISGKDALTSAPASTDEFLVSDAGVLKRIDASLVGRGKVLQVVSTAAANDLGTTSTSFVDINLSLNITPSATSSKIFVTYTGNNETNGTGGNKLSLQMLRDSTQIADATGVGSLGSEGGIVTSNALSVLDEPSTTSQITYKMQGKSDDGTIMVFNVNNDLGTITAFEIAG
jgi:hypothetical protein